MPADLCHDLVAIAAAERMTVRDLVIDAVRELVAAYAARDDAFVKCGARTELETVWAPHRDAPSLLGDRLSKAS